MAFPSSVPCFEHSDGPPVPYAGENVVLGMMEGMQALHGLHREAAALVQGQRHTAQTSPSLGGGCWLATAQTWELVPRS